MGKTGNDLLWWEAYAYSGQLFKIRFSGSVLYWIVSTPRRRPAKHLFLTALQERKSRVHNPLSSPAVYFYNFFRSADFQRREHNKQVSRRRSIPAAFRKLMMVSTRRGIQRLFYSKCSIKVLVILTISTFSICVFLHGRMGRTEENEIVGEFPIGIGE